MAPTDTEQKEPPVVETPASAGTTETAKENGARQETPKKVEEGDAKAEEEAKAEEKKEIGGGEKEADAKEGAKEDEKDDTSGVKAETKEGEAGEPDNAGEGGKKGDDGSAKKRRRKDWSVASPPLIDRPQRERRAPAAFVVEEPKKPKLQVEVKKGKGTALKDIPAIAGELSKRRKTTELHALLHFALFGVKAKAVQADVLRNLLEFSGFAFEDEAKDRKKMRERFATFTIKGLQDLQALLHLPPGGRNKEERLERVLQFLEAPSEEALEAATSPVKSKATPTKKRGSARKGRKPEDGEEEEEEEEEGGEEAEEEEEEEEKEKKAGHAKKSRGRPSKRQKTGAPGKAAEKKEATAVEDAEKEAPGAMDVDAKEGGEGGEEKAEAEKGSEEKEERAEEKTEEKGAEVKREEKKSEEKPEDKAEEKGEEKTEEKKSEEKTEEKKSEEKTEEKNSEEKAEDKGEAEEKASEAAKEKAAEPPAEAEGDAGKAAEAPAAEAK